MCASDVCTQKTVYQKFELIWFKTHDFNAINMIIRTKTDVVVFFSYQVRAVMVQLYSGKGGGKQQLICI